MPWLASGVASGIAFVALALLVHGGPLALDLSVAAWLQPLRQGPAGILIHAVNLLGQPLIWDALVVAIGVSLWRRGLRWEAVVLVAGVLAAEAGASLAKVLIGRARPPGIVVADLITQASYPSGHVTRAVVTAGLLVSMTRRRRAWRASAIMLAGALVVVMSVARIVVGEHWFSDVAGAVLFGVTALATIRVTEAVVGHERDRYRPAAPPRERPGARGGSGTGPPT